MSGFTCGVCGETTMCGSLCSCFEWSKDECRMVQTKSRNDTEPAPKPSDCPAVWDLVLRDIEERDSRGVERYGQRLTPHDGRRSLVDAYQEALDLVVYLRKALYEQDGW